MKSLPRKVHHVFLSIRSASTALTSRHRSRISPASRATFCTACCRQISAGAQFVLQGSALSRPARSGRGNPSSAVPRRRRFAQISKDSPSSPAPAHREPVDLASEARAEHRLQPHQRQADQTDRPRQPAPNVIDGALSPGRDGRLRDQADHHRLARREAGHLAAARRIRTDRRGPTRRSARLGPRPWRP